MRIEKIHIKGFRNFEDEEIFFQPKTLIIGANDVGKTNLLYALRILFDKSISEHDLDLKDSDYNAYCNTDTVEITATICDVTEECLLSTFGGAVKDGVVLIRYSNSKNGQYSIWMGYDENVLTEYSTRQYIKRLNMQYVDTNRDLFKFLKHERLQILHISKELLKEEQKLADEENTKEIQNKLNEINNQISSLNYVASALENVNIELSELSVDNEDQKIRFIAGESDAGKLLDNLTLSFSTGDNLLSIGGDGRNNQIFLATWIAKQNIQKNVDHTKICGVVPWIRMLTKTEANRKFSISNLPYWIMANGCADDPDTIIDESRWKSKYGRYLSDVLEKFHEMYTKPVKVFIYPIDNEKNLERVVEALRQCCTSHSFYDSLRLCSYQKRA